MANNFSLNKDKIKIPGRFFLTLVNSWPALAGTIFGEIFTEIKPAIWAIFPLVLNTFSQKELLSGITSIL